MTIQNQSANAAQCNREIREIREIRFEDDSQRRDVFLAPSISGRIDGSIRDHR